MSCYLSGVDGRRSSRFSFGTITSLVSYVTSLSAHFFASESTACLLPGVRTRLKFLLLLLLLAWLLSLRAIVKSKSDSLCLVRLGMPLSWLIERRNTFATGNNPLKRMEKKTISRRSQSLSYNAENTKQTLWNWWRYGNLREYINSSFACQLLLSFRLLLSLPWPWDV